MQSTVRQTVGLSSVRGISVVILVFFALVVSISGAIPFAPFICLRFSITNMAVMTKKRATKRTRKVHIMCECFWLRGTRILPLTRWFVLLNINIFSLLLVTVLCPVSPSSSIVQWPNELKTCLSRLHCGFT